MKTKSNQWRLKSGLLYAGLNRSLQCVLVGPDDAQIFDERDNPEIKSKFYGALTGVKFEVEQCAS